MWKCVIASEAKQSGARSSGWICFVAGAPRNEIVMAGTSPAMTETIE
jgi:hypothetical protein